MITLVHQCCNLFSHNGYVLFLSPLTHDSEIKMKMKAKQKRGRNGVDKQKGHKLSEVKVKMPCSKVK